MSMRDYGVNDYGMVLYCDELKMLASKICHSFSDKEWNADFSYRYECADEIVEKLGVEYISEFYGEALLIDENGETKWSDSMTFSDDIIYYVPLSHFPNLFRSWYKDLDEAADDIRRRVGEYFPEDFDFRNKIRHIVGTYYG